MKIFIRKSHNDYQAMTILMTILYKMKISIVQKTFNMSLREKRGKSVPIIIIEAKYLGWIILEFPILKQRDITIETKPNSRN